MSTVAGLLRSLALPAAEIAERSDLPLGRVVAIMEGAPVDHAELRALAHGLRLPLRAFPTGRLTAQRDDDLGVLFRSPAGGRAAADHLSTVERVAGFVEAALRVLPKRTRPPEWLEQFKAAEETYGEAQRLAHLFRSLFVEPARAGVVVGRLVRSRYEGASVIAGGHLFVFVSPRFPPRVLFTFAHEIGHIVAHHRRGPMAVFERPTQIGYGRRGSRAERFVDAFASGLLMPERGVGIALKTIRRVLNVPGGPLGDIELLYLARIFGVSFEVAARRCEQLGLLPEGSAASLADVLRRRHGSPERRADEIGLTARPPVAVPAASGNLIRAIVQRIEAGDVSAGWAAERFGLPIEDVYSAHAGASRDPRRA